MAEIRSDAPSNNVLDRSAQPLRPSEVLERAAALIEPEGAWTQGQYGRRAGEAVPSDKLREADCLCAFGALTVAARAGSAAEMERGHPAGKYLCLALGFGYAGEVEDWNDEPNRTQAEVVDALKRAAELARSEGQ